MPPAGILLNPIIEMTSPVSPTSSSTTPTHHDSKLIEIRDRARSERNVFKAARAHVAFELPSVKTKKRSNLILLPQGAFKPWWDLLVVLLVIYSAFSLPVTLCFNIGTSDFALKSWDIFVDVVFYFDVIFYFFTAYEKNGVTIFSRKRIALHYLKSWFVVDLIASLPWEQLTSAFGGGNSVFISVLRGAKILRLLRLSRLLKFLETHQMVSHAMRMIRLLFFFFLFAHWVGCVWFAIGNHSAQQDPPEGWLLALTPPLDPSVTPFADLYITSVYWVFTTWVTIGYGDVTPKTDLEKCFAMCTMLAGAVIYATIFGNVAVLLQSLGRLDNIFKEKMENINFYMNDLQLPMPLQVRVRNYYTFLWARHKSFSSSNQLEELSPSLQNQIAHFLHQDTIEKCSIFKNAEDTFLRSVTTRLKFCVSLPGDFIFHEDDAGDKIYFLRKGRIEISTEDLGLLTTLEEGGYFGECSLIVPIDSGRTGGGDPADGLSDVAFLKRKRSASAKSVVNSDMYFLLKEEFLAILTLYPQYQFLFLDIAKQRLKQTKQHSDELLVEKILESHAKKGWLKLKGHKKQKSSAANLNASKRKISLGGAAVMAAMQHHRPSTMGASTSLGGGATAAGATSPISRGLASPSEGGTHSTPGSPTTGAIASMRPETPSSAVDSDKPRLGAKGRRLLAAAREYKERQAEGKVPPFDPSKVEPRKIPPVKPSASSSASPSASAAASSSAATSPAAPQPTSAATTSSTAARASAAPVRITTSAPTVPKPAVRKMPKFMMEQ